MTGVLKFDIHRTGTLAALPYAVMWISSIIFGWMCDKIVKRNWMTVTNARKTFTTIGENSKQKSSKESFIIQRNKSRNKMTKCTMYLM